MFAFLHLTWKPSNTEDSPPQGKAPAIIRGDTYNHTIRVTDGVANGFDDWDWSAQIRVARLKAGATVGAPLAEFTVTLEADGDDLLVHLSLTPAQTLTLPASGFWDLQLTDGSTVTTWLAGGTSTLDDVTRVA